MVVYDIRYSIFDIRYSKFNIFHFRKLISVFDITYLILGNLYLKYDTVASIVIQYRIPNTEEQIWVPRINYSKFALAANACCVGRSLLNITNINIANITKYHRHENQTKNHDMTKSRPVSVR